MEQSQFNNKLRELRKGSRLTQKQLSERLGVAKSVVSYYEQGSRFPSYDVLIKIARIFHVTTDYLLGIEHNRVIDVTGLNDKQVQVLNDFIDVLLDKK